MNGLCRTIPPSAFILLPSAFNIHPSSFIPHPYNSRLMSFLDRLLGKPLTTAQSDEEKIGVAAGVPILGLDGLSSAAYGPEAALTILIPLGLLGLQWIVPITISILALLAILYFSYRQTIAAYPSGGGSYIVAKENLGTGAGLVAAAALLLDYVLNVAVGISAGIGALVSAVPALQPHILALCLVTLVIITVVNLRGVRESGAVFGIPTYLFVITLLIVIGGGLVKMWTSGGHPLPAVPLPPVPMATEAVGLWLLLRAFASGCTAMTGVEAVSNGVPAFRNPAVRNAQRTLTAIVVILAVLLAGIAFLAHGYGIVAMRQEAPGYQSILSLLVAAVFGRGTFYYVTIASVLTVLALSANTSFAGFPRLCRMVAEDDYLPHSFANVGRRLVYSNGILVLAVLSAILLIIFGGITDRLIPLFAVGAFGAFTLSQAGMVMHWRRMGGHGSHLSLSVNAVGAIVTGIALLIILVAKFVDGAWITMILIPGSLLLFHGVKRHYRSVAATTTLNRPIDLAKGLHPPVVIVPVKGWDLVTERAIRFGMRISPDVIAVHIATDEEAARKLAQLWTDYVESPVAAADRPFPKLVTIPSPDRRLFTPLLDYVEQVKCEGDRLVAVIIPDLVEDRWWQHLLHNHRADVLRELLLMRGNQRVIVITVPWHTAGPGGR
jgi:amino acid transporter